MKQDAATRIQIVNTLMGTIDKEVTDTWNKVVDSFVQDNLELTQGLEKMFYHNQVYYPQRESSRYKTSFLRKNVKDIHADLQKEFDDMHQVFIKDFQLFRGKYKNLLGSICRVATQLDTFNEVLPSSLMKIINKSEVSYVALRTAQGWQSEEHKQDFIKTHKEVIDKAVYYSNIGHLL